MDDLDRLLANLAQVPPPADSLARVAPSVQRTLRRRIVTKLCLAAAATIAAAIVALPGPQAEIPLPEPVRAIIEVPDLILSSPAPAPLKLSRYRAKPKAIDASTVQLASTDKNVVIYWSL